jgi:ABC-type spermidine/putrescine transport system permease subunit II
VRRGRALRLAGWGYCGLILLFLLFPVAIMVPASLSGSQTLEFPPSSWSLHWYRQVLGYGRWLNAGLLSLRVALFAAAAATAAGLMVGLAHLRFGRLTPTLRAFFLLPLVAPHIVLATGLFSLLLQVRALGSPIVLAFGHACLALPLTVVVFINAVEAIEPLLWPAAASLGARSWMILREILLPNLSISLVVAFLLAFIASWDEVTFAVFIGPISTPTLPSRMFSYLQELLNPSIAAVATILVGLTLSAGLVSVLLPRLRRRSPRMAP